MSAWGTLTRPLCPRHCSGIPGEQLGISAAAGIGRLVPLPVAWAGDHQEQCKMFNLRGTTGIKYSVPRDCLDDWTPELELRERKEAHLAQVSGKRKPSRTAWHYRPCLKPLSIVRRLWSGQGRQVSRRRKWRRSFRSMASLASTQ